MQTQLGRPTLFEAYIEAGDSPDSHWTSNVSTIGMTRIKRETVIHTYDSHLADPFDTFTEINGA